MEAKDPSVSIDLMIRTLVNLGATMETVGVILCQPDERRVSQELKKVARHAVAARA
jgi:hypothetical protein